MTRDKEIQLEPTVDRILDLHLRFGKRDLNEESPKSVCANNRDNRVPRVNQIGGRTDSYMQERMIRTHRARCTRKCPYRGPSVLVHWGPRGLRRMFGS